MVKRTYLKSKLLIAMPGIQGDDFAGSVVFMCAHNAEGAMGLVINKPAPRMIFSDIAEKLDVKPTNAMIADDILQMPILFGGPVKQFQGFVLHSPDYKSDDSLVVSPEFVLSSTIDILREIAKGQGPKRKLLALMVL